MDPTTTTTTTPRPAAFLPDQLARHAHALRVAAHEAADPGLDLGERLDLLCAVAAEARFVERLLDLMQLDGARPPVRPSEFGP
jgi:hypothetical protein